MSKRFSYLPLLFLIFSLFFFMSLPKSFQTRLRLFSISSLAPVYEGLSDFRHLFLKTVLLLNGPKNDGIEKKQLLLENELLKAQSKGIYDWLMHDQRIDEQMQRLKNLQIEQTQTNYSYWQNFFRRRSEELKKILEIELQTVPAKIVFRDPANWNAQLWINVGEELNATLGHRVIGTNSPVVVADSVVGIVEYVGQKFSRIRLVTDANLSVSVRAVRGAEADRALALQCKTFKEALSQREDLMEKGDKELFFTLLQEIRSKLLEKKANYYLAKGELHGSLTPAYRTSSRTLSGKGFNYDFADSEGPARDLKTGKVLDEKFAFLNQPLIKKGDLLVTTGLDGIFPAGLKMGLVTEVGHLTDASYCYDLKALPAVLDLMDLNIVFIMPPLAFFDK